MNLKSMSVDSWFLKVINGGNNTNPMKNISVFGILGLVAIGIALVFIPANSLVLAASACPGLNVMGPLQATLPASSTSTLTYNITWAGFTNPTTITVMLNSPPSGWTWSVSPTHFTAKGSGSTTVTVTVMTPALVGSQASLTVNATDGKCGGHMTTAAHTTGLNTTPEFAAGMLVAVGVGTIAIMALRRQATKLPVAN